MADPVLRPLVDRGLPSHLSQLQQVGDGLSDSGSGSRYGGQAGAIDAQSAGASTQGNRFDRFPEPMRSLLRRAASSR